MPRAKAAAEHVVAKVVDSGRDIHDKIVGGKKPSMKFPLRSLSNVRYTPKKGVLRDGGEEEGTHPHRLHGQDLRADPAHTTSWTSTCRRS